MRKYITEALGSFILVFCGTGSIVINQQFEGSIGHVGVAMTFGLVVMTLIYALGNISGAHFNPAVTIAFTVARKFTVSKLYPYIFSQLSGAVMASIFLKYLFPQNDFLGSTLPSGTVMQSFLIEIFLSFFLMLVILNVAHGSVEQGLFAGLAIGSTVLLEAMFAGPITGASMNPARSIAPAIVSGHVTHLWIYITAPILGTVAAVPVWRFTSADSKSNKVNK